jgi:Poly(R)-hydroxyalkanoic acid synthase subunit (PHA_synth_III_E)
MTQAPFDPLALWRDMLAKWQAAVSDTAGKAAAPAEYVRLMNQTLGMSVQLQQALGMMMGNYLAALNMPTRADLAAMDARLRAIEEQLARLAHKVEATAVKPAAAATLRVDADAPRRKRAPQPSSRPEPAEAPAAVHVAAQAAHAAKPARRVAKKHSKAS